MLAKSKTPTTIVMWVVQNGSVKMIQVEVRCDDLILSSVLVHAYYGSIMHDWNHWPRQWAVSVNRRLSTSSAQSPIHCRVMYIRCSCSWVWSRICREVVCTDVHGGGRQEKTTTNVMASLESVNRVVRGELCILVVMVLVCLMSEDVDASAPDSFRSPGLSTSRHFVWSSNLLHSILS